MKESVVPRSHMIPGPIRTSSTGWLQDTIRLGRCTYHELLPTHDCTYMLLLRIPLVVLLPQVVLLGVIDR